MDFLAKNKKKAFIKLVHDFTQMIVLVGKVYLLAIVCFNTIEIRLLIRVCKWFAKMFANFLQITIYSQDSKYRLSDLNNIGKGSR